MVLIPNVSDVIVLAPNIPDVPDIRVTPPKDEHLRHVIDSVALYVLDGGCAFEQAIMEILFSTSLSLAQRNIPNTFGTPLICPCPTISFVILFWEYVTKQTY